MRLTLEVKLGDDSWRKLIFETVRKPLKFIENFPIF